MLSEREKNVKASMPSAATAAVKDRLAPFHATECLKRALVDVKRPASGPESMMCCALDRAPIRFATRMRAPGGIATAASRARVIVLSGAPRTETDCEASTTFHAGRAISVTPERTPCMVMGSIATGPPPDTHGRSAACSVIGLRSMNEMLTPPGGKGTARVKIAECLARSQENMWLKRAASGPVRGSVPDAVWKPSRPPMVTLSSAGRARSACRVTLICEKALETEDDAEMVRVGKYADGAKLSEYVTAPCHAIASANRSTFESMLKLEPL
mmetsp:Transcript_63530/g.151483  ORF Transcript_63530/g.151483 Transcript_63530/m.151483 type:complete len:271 (-) Transcript_63530:665-1477(-)